jgi:DNA-binding response OmpR family regulator
MKRLLLIEDGEDIGELIKVSLRERIVLQARSIAEGKAFLSENNFDLLLIDVTLPDGSGFDLCQELSRDPRYEKVPKIILTARHEVSDKVFGFNCGAQDYVTKPFHLLELKARVDRFLPVRTEADAESIESCFAFNVHFQKCYLIEEDGQRQDLKLTPTEFRLLLTLVRSEGQTLSRRILEQTAWESNGTSIQIRGIDTHIAHLRKKLGSAGSMIVSVYGQGYAFQPTVC